MKELMSYLNDLERKYGGSNKAAKMLGVSKSAVSHMKTRKQMADETALKMAELLEIEPSEILLAATIARSEGNVKKEWEKISRMSLGETALLWIAGSAAPALTTAWRDGIDALFCILC